MQGSGALDPSGLATSAEADAHAGPTFVDARFRLLGLGLGHWALIAVAGALLAPFLTALSRGPTAFDDSYMFWRYAVHVRDGLGIAWNPDGVQTYGLTSHLWLLAVLPFTFLPLSPSTGLQIASTLAAAGAMYLMGLAVSRHARSDVLRERNIAIAAASLPLLINPLFTFHVTTGMDTMLSMATHAAIVLVVLEYAARPSMQRAAIVGAVAFAAVLTRPENGLAALGVPFLVFLWMRQPGRWRDLAGLVVLPVALIGLKLLVCTLVFGVPLPLSFYAKSLHAYAGFQNPENAVQYMLLAMVSALPFAVVACGVTRRRDLAFMAAFLLPVIVTFVYFLTVRQVMGWIGRYYLPFLPYLIIPALLMLDADLADKARRSGLARRLGIALVAVLAAVAVTWPVQRWVEAQYMRMILPERVALPALPTTAGGPVPKRTWFAVIRLVSDEIVRPLPAGAVVAASEVGYLGAVNPGVTLIDIVGLNDTTIGRQGFSTDYLLSRKPDFLWMPADDYTGLVATIYSDPRLFERYIVVRDAFNYGFAIAKDGPNRAQVEAGVRKVWAELYPGLRLEDYIVRR